jgi:primosomal replication protein N
LLLHARQAEASLRRLREVRIAPAITTGEVIQSLTVLVLSADMLAQGYLTDRQNTELLLLLTRNVRRAIDGVAKLRDDMVRVLR